MSSTWASVVPDGTVPKDYPRHFDGLSARPVASVSRRSPRSRANRGPPSGFLGVGRASWSGQGPARELVDKGQHIEVSAEHVAQGQRPRAGHCRRLWERLWERRIELGTNTYEVLVPRAPPEGGTAVPGASTARVFSPTGGTSTHRTPRTA